MDFEAFVKALQEKEFLRDGIDSSEVLKDKDVKKFMKVYKKTSPSTRKSPPATERQGVFDPNKCHARIWLEGYDNVQCGFAQVKGCFCNKSSHQSCAEGEWWLGNINDEPPEKPILYSDSNPDGLEHKWRTEDNVKETIINVDESNDAKPKKRGRPKGSKNKKKVKEEGKPEITMEELQAMIEKKQKDEA